MTRARLLAPLTVTLLLAVSGVVAPVAHAAEIEPRVVNGREPVDGEVDPLVYINAGGSICSGALVDPTHVITAGHCAHGRSATSITVGWAPGGALPMTVWVPVSSVAVHPDYNNSTFANDIAVLTLAIPLSGAAPISLASVDESRKSLSAGRHVRAVGFGATIPTGGASNVAFAADLHVVPDSVCQKGAGTYTVDGVTFHSPWIYEYSVDTRTAVCAIGVQPQTGLITDTCQGDSGGPLFGGKGKNKRLLGIVSIGIGCAGFDGDEQLEYPVPGIYTRIAPYLTWLSGIGVRSTPAAPTITATSTGTDGITITFAPGNLTTPTGYRAVVSGAGGDVTCTTTTTECTITGLAAGTGYTAVGYATIGTAESVASASVVVVAGIPTAKPTKPRIDRATVTPGKRLAITLDRVDEFDWTSTFVICRAGDKTYRGGVLDGRVVLTLPRGVEYRCYAKSSNTVGGSRSKPIRVLV